MNVENGTEALIFLFWEYLFQISGILSLQCGMRFSSDWRGVSLCVQSGIYFLALWQKRGARSSEAAGETNICIHHIHGDAATLPARVSLNVSHPDQ